MSFKDVFKKSFLEGFSTVDMSTDQIIIVLGFTCVIGLYIFFCYRLLTRRTFYSGSFNISLVAMAILTAAIILTIQSSVVVSLGMVGALSIVRFRTAIKDPMDLVFMFWSIGVGIICGAGLVEIAVLASLTVTTVLFILDRIPVAKAPMILTINADTENLTDKEIEETISQYTKYSKEKTRNLSNDRMDLVYELRVKDGKGLSKELYRIKGVSSVSLLAHDGEVTF